jgi:hypothetical protein
MEKASFYNIPIYINLENNYIEGRNLMYNLLLDIMIFIHVNFIVHITGLYDFPIKIYRKSK